MIQKPYRERYPHKYFENTQLATILFQNLTGSTGSCLKDLPPLPLANPVLCDFRNSRVKIADKEPRESSQVKLSRHTRSELQGITFILLFIRLFFSSGNLRQALSKEQIKKFVMVLVRHVGFN